MHYLIDDELVACHASAFHTSLRQQHQILHRFGVKPPSVVPIETHQRPHPLARRLRREQQGATWSFEICGSTNDILMGHGWEKDMTGQAGTTNRNHGKKGKGRNSSFYT